MGLFAKALKERGIKVIDVEEVESFNLLSCSTSINLTQTFKIEYQPLIIGPPGGKFFKGFLLFLCHFSERM